MHEELKTAGEYVRAVSKHWGVIIIVLGLTVVDFVERIFGTWFVFPLWLRLTIGISGLIVAQYLAYRDFVKAKYKRFMSRSTPQQPMTIFVTQTLNSKRRLAALPQKTPES